MGAGGGGHRLFTSPQRNPSGRHGPPTPENSTNLCLETTGPTGWNTPVPHRGEKRSGAACVKATRAVRSKPYF